MKYCLYFLLFLSLLSVASCGNELTRCLYDQAITEYVRHKIVYGSSESDEVINLPESKDELEIIYHKYYTLGYSEPNEQAAWVQYMLTQEMVNGSTKRENHFREDPTVSTGSSIPSDYKNSGFDRGHLAPNADFLANHEMMDESFYMSNISPQYHKFNAGIWLKLEDTVRNMVRKNDSLIVVTGPIFDNIKNSKHTIGKKNIVTVPVAFYKVIFDPKNNVMIGFVILHTNEQIKRPVEDFITTVDEIELLTNLDFFKNVNNESSLESVKGDLNLWLN